jgi:hypothetical protein
MAHHRRYRRMPVPSADELRSIEYRRSIIAAAFAPPEPLILKVNGTLYANAPAIKKLREALPLSAAESQLGLFSGLALVEMPRWMEGLYRRSPAAPAPASPRP